MRSKISVPIVLLLIGVILILACSPNESVTEDKDQVSIQSLAAPSAFSSDIGEAEEWEGSSYTVMLAPTLFSNTGLYLTSFEYHSIGYLYKNFIITSGRNTTNLMERLKDPTILQGIENGDMVVRIVRIKSFLPVFDYEFLDLVEIEFPQDYHRDLKENLAVFQSEKFRAENPEMPGHVDDISVGDEVNIIGQVKVGERFELVRRPGSIVAISPSKDYFQIQGAITFHDMGGIVIWTNDKGDEIPIGIVIARQFPYEGQATATFLSIVKELIDNRGAGENK